MLKLEVIKIVDGMAECRYFFDSEYKNYALKTLDLADCSKHRIGQFIVQEFKDTFSSTPKRKD